MVDMLPARRCAYLNSTTGAYGGIASSDSSMCSVHWSLTLVPVRTYGVLLTAISTPLTFICCSTALIVRDSAL
jgi:hypothetical protein